MAPQSGPCSLVDVTSQQFRGGVSIVLQQLVARSGPASLCEGGEVVEAFIVCYGGKGVMALHID
jgi:hypothetical protein